MSATSVISWMLARSPRPSAINRSTVRDQRCPCLPAPGCRATSRGRPTLSRHVGSLT
jgi:hypothetical protein